MPPPVVRQTLKSASRASANDEKIRQEKVTAQLNDPKSKGRSSSVCGTTVIRIVQREQNNTLQKEKRIEKEDKWKSGEVGRLPESRNHMGSSNSHDRGVKSGQSSGATGTSSRGFPPSLKIPTGGIQDPYGYTKISASQAKLYRDNLDFYLNKIPSKPIPGYTIEEMLRWKGNYGMLERNHRYIQWLFPIPEGNGLNMYAQQLCEHEAQAIRDDKTTLRRVLMAYRMMLDFYGMQLVSSTHGAVERSIKGWQERYDHLNRSRHNLLRITRILKSLGELGYERLQAPWVNFLIEEAVVKEQLPNLNGPCLMHWIMAVKDDGERETLYRKANGLPISQDNVDMDGIYSESEDEDEGGELETKDLDQNDIEMSKLTLKNCEIQQKTKDDELLKHDDKAMAMLKQANVADSVNAASVSKEKIEKADAKHNKDNVEAMQDRYDIPQESVKDKTVKTTTIGMNPTVKGETTSGKKSTEELTQQMDNLKFYQNILHSRPSPGFTIETILKYKGDHRFFDEYPGFIQWLFPVHGSTGRNVEAQPLQEHEAKTIRDDDELSSRVLEAFKMMLDFYGMRLCDDLTGKFKRIEKTYKERYDYLQRCTVNYLRITRILMSIGELGLDRFQCPWIDFLIKEGIEKAKFPTLDGRSIQHWIGAIKDEGEKYEMLRKYQKLAGHKALIIDTEEDMEVSNDVYCAHSNRDTEVDYATAGGAWGDDSLDFV